MVKKFKPVTAGLRHLIMPSFEELTKKDGKKVKPVKSLLKPKRRISGRNHAGRVCCRHRGGAHKRRLRVIDFRRDKEGIEAKIASVEYDPNRTTFIALLHYADGEKRYILAPQGIKVGDVVSSGEGAAIATGCCMKMTAMPLGSVVHNIELYPGKGGKLVRSAGSSAQIMARSDGYATLKMPSGEIRLIKEECRATLGVLSNAEHNLRREGKAGRVRWKGIRPTVRGTAMNPIDHPHGGGEGKHRGNIPQTPWGKPTKGKKTRHKKKSTWYIVKGKKKK